MAAYFTFIGQVELNQLDSKIPFKREGKTSSGADYASFNMAVVPAKNNRAFVEVFGMIRNTIKTKNTNGDDIEVNWDDRNDPDIIKTVAYNKRYSITLDGNRHDFISDYDFVQFLIANADTIKGKTFIVRGSTSINEYKGNLSFRYQFNSMVEVTDEETKNDARVTATYFWTADDIDTADWKKKRIVTINACTSNYINKELGNRYVATPFIIDLSKADLDDERIQKIVNFRLKQLGLELADDSIKLKIKKGVVVSLPVECAYINGNEEVPFDESQLTENQKMAIDLGINTVDDFRPKGSIFGNKITIFKYKNADLRTPYENGYRTEEITVTDFENNVYTAKAVDSATSATPVTENKSVNMADIDALFG